LRELVTAPSIPFLSKRGLLNKNILFKTNFVGISRLLSMPPFEKENLAINV
jgi:hypothetical protein